VERVFRTLERGIGAKRAEKQFFFGEPKRNYDDVHFFVVFLFGFSFLSLVLYDAKIEDQRSQISGLNRRNRVVCTTLTG
jgi:hypothetical protein